MPDPRLGRKLKSAQAFLFLSSLLFTGSQTTARLGKNVSDSLSQFHLHRASSLSIELTLPTASIRKWLRGVRTVAGVRDIFLKRMWCFHLWHTCDILVGSTAPPAWMHEYDHARKISLWDAIFFLFCMIQCLFSAVSYWPLQYLEQHGLLWQTITHSDSDYDSIFFYMQLLWLWF